MEKITNEKKMTMIKKKKKKSSNGVNTNKSGFKQEIFKQDEIDRICWLNMKLTVLNYN